MYRSGFYLLIIVAVSLLSFDLTGKWYKGGTKSVSYTADEVAGAGRDGKSAFTLKSAEDKIDGYGTIVIEKNPGIFAGKRVRMTAVVKTSDVSGWAGLYLRAEKAGSAVPLVTDNMRDRGIKGTSDWKKCEIVVDIPANTTKMIYGGILSGTGQVWFENPVMEEVSNSVAVTAQPVVQKHSDTK